MKNMVEVANFLKKALSVEKIVIFSKTSCGYCQNVKKLFSGLKIPFNCIELDQLANGYEFLGCLLEKNL